METKRDSFVLWLERAGEATCLGQVEHLRTATRTGFGGSEELLAFLRARFHGAHPTHTDDPGPGGGFRP